MGQDKPLNWIKNKNRKLPCPFFQTYLLLVWETCTTENGKQNVVLFGTAKDWLHEMVSTWQLYKLYINRPPSRPASCDSSCSIWEENTRHIAKQSVKSRLPTSWPGRWTGLPNVKYNTEQLLLMCTHHTYRGIIFFIWCALLLKHNISYIQNIHLTYKACHREIKPPPQTALKDN